ncbi:hypothetical protein [Vibrio nomapromontoriensis]|uniref:hypothetical protein n=1 Tax=Vibrio nomapromontoriensis TaxID=2910246 RepID=UPI003D0A35F3
MDSEVKKVIVLSVATVFGGLLIVWGATSFRDGRILSRFERFDTAHQHCELRTMVHYRDGLPKRAVYDCDGVETIWEK